MAAHYEAAHGAFTCEGAFEAKVLDDGTKIAQMPLDYGFKINGKGWFVYSGLDPAVFSTAVGGCFALDLQRINDNELRFGVRQLGRGPPRHRLSSVTVRFGPADGNCVQYVLSRALASDERIRDAALCAGTPPVVRRVDPAFLAPALVRRSGTPLGDPPPEKPWKLEIMVSLVFHTHP